MQDKFYWISTFLYEKQHRKNLLLQNRYVLKYIMNYMLKKLNLKFPKFSVSNRFYSFKSLMLQSAKRESMNEFISNFQTVIIGTIDEHNKPFSSYAPFIHDSNRFYIYISDIATHAKNLHVNPAASLFFIEDESKSQNLFARKRISLQCDSVKIQRESQRFEEIFEQFAKRFDGSLIATLKNMLDFNLYELHVKGGEATFGFGEAYTIGGENMDQLIPRRSGGHHSKK